MQLKLSAWNAWKVFFHFSPLPSDSHISNGFLLSPQVQPQAPHSLTIQSPPPSHPAPARGVMNAPFAMRMQWTRSSTPVGTCVSAMPAVSNSRRWPMRAVPSAGGQSKTSSRPTGARRLALGYVRFSSGHYRSHVRLCKDTAQALLHVQSGSGTLDSIIMIF